MSFTPRDYQVSAVRRARESRKAGNKSILLVGPTGMGKTVLATMLAQGAIQKDKRIGFFVHREELQDQAAAAFKRIGVDAGIVRGNAQGRSWMQLQIVSIQTAAIRGVNDRFDLVFLDEAHHFVAEQWRKPIDKIRADDTTIIGLTATPDRGDGKGLGGETGIFDDLIVVCQPLELIEAGHLVPCRVVGPTKSTQTLAEDPVAAYKEWARGAKTIVFCRKVSYAKKLATHFTAAGFPAACVDGNMDETKRAETIERFRNGQLMVLTNVMVLTEGFDVPATSCVITTTGASAPAPLIQKVGRAMRPYPGKTECVHIDLRGAWFDVAMLPGDDRSFSLQGTAITAIEREEGTCIARCPNCGLMFRANDFQDSRCPGCGYKRPGREDPRVRRARMAVMDAGTGNDLRIKWLARKISEGRRLRKADGTPYKATAWAVHQYVKRFGAETRLPWPSNDIVKAAVSMANAMQWGE